MARLTSFIKRFERKVIIKLMATLPNDLSRYRQKIAMNRRHLYGIIIMLLTAMLLPWLQIIECIDDW